MISILFEAAKAVTHLPARLPIVTPPQLIPTIAKPATITFASMMLLKPSRGYSIKELTGIRAPITITAIMEL